MWLIARRMSASTAARKRRPRRRRAERFAQEGGMEIGGGAALVSGGASGLGRATARALAAAGMKVAILDVHAAAAAEAAKEIGGLPLACDVTDAASVERAVAAARQQHGPARIAVCCAG